MILLGGDLIDIVLVIVWVFHRVSLAVFLLPVRLGILCLLHHGRLGRRHLLRVDLVAVHRLLLGGVALLL